MHILVTNDDGVTSPGLLALKQALEPLGQVSVIAPDRNRSAIARSITIHSSLWVEEVALADGTPAYATDGTPVDCVRLATLGLLGGTPDVIVSGINMGLNLGDDVTYSGTVAAALEGVLLGWPAIAVSQEPVAGGDGDAGGLPPYDFRAVASFVRRLVPLACAATFPRQVLLSVNAPGLTPDDVRGARVTRLGRRIYNDRLHLETQEGARRRYRIYGDEASYHQEEGTDFEAIENREISVTPLHFDLTDLPGMDALERWELGRLLEEEVAPMRMR
ncbi:MAG: 5'/3'-nucleotidase SurE [Actinomycetota bacterium]